MLGPALAWCWGSFLPILFLHKEDPECEAGCLTHLDLQGEEEVDTLSLFHLAKAGSDLVDLEKVVVGLIIVIVLWYQDLAIVFTLAFCCTIEPQWPEQQIRDCRTVVSTERNGEA